MVDTQSAAVVIATSPYHSAEGCQPPILCMAARMVQPHTPTDVENMQDYLINWNAGPLGVVLRPDLGVDMPPLVVQLLPQPSVLKMAGVREGDLLISVNGKKTTRLGYEKVVRLLFQERLPMVLHFRSPLQQRGVPKAIKEEPARARARTSSSAHPQTLPNRPRGRSDVQQIEQKRHPNVQNLSIQSDVSATPHKSKKSKKSKSKHKHGAKAEAEEKRLRKQYSVLWERGSLGISFRAYNSKVNVPCVDFISASRGQGRGMDLVCVNDVLIAINGEKTKALGVEKVLRWLHVVEKPAVLRFHASSNRVLDPAGGLLPHSTDDQDTSRRPTKPQTQPEFEPVPRPPRRNNSLDQSMQRVEREYLDDRENGLQPAVLRRYSKDRGMCLEKQPIEEYESPYQFGASNIKVKERGYTNNLKNAYVQGREDGGAGDFRREPMATDALHVDERINDHISSHRRQQREDATHSSQPNQAQLLPVRSRTNSASRDDLRCQQQSESKSAQRQVTAAARPRLASRDSQVSNTSQLSFDEAADVVARATGKPVEACEFGGVPVLEIKEGTVQSKLMYIYAKACLAKEGNSDDKPGLKEPQPARIPGNPLGRKTHSKYLSYTILQDDAVASKHVPSPGNGCISNESMVEQEEEHKVEVINESIEPENAGVPEHRLDESFARMQKDISIQPPPVTTPSLSSVGPSSSVSSDTTSNVPPAPAPVADDFISLKDFVVKGGNLTERPTTSSHNSTATPVQSMGGGQSDKTQEHEENLPTTNDTYKEAIVEATSEASGEAIEEGMTLIELKEATYDDSNRADPITDENQQAEKPEKMVVLEEERSNANEDEHADDHKDAEVEHAHEDDDVSGIESPNERDLSASVASLDDLLNLSFEDGNHDDEEQEEFVDGDDDKEKNEKIRADDKESMNTSLGMKLGLVQEEEDGEMDDFEVQEPFEEHEHGNGDDDHEEKEEFENGALSNPLVNELFRNNLDVREVIKDKSALMVLVKKSMMDEIQEILQSLQMELQFERHSTMAVGSTASPLCISQQDLDTEGQQCYRCGATGELAELSVASEQSELYCQECWELFFYSEDRQSPVTRTSKTLAPSEVGRLTADEDALDEALKYSFHDSSVSREDIIHPWRYLQGSNSLSSTIRDSNASSITDRADEVWL